MHPASAPLLDPHNDDADLISNADYFGNISTPIPVDAGYHGSASSDSVLALPQEPLLPAMLRADAGMSDVSCDDGPSGCPSRNASTSRARPRRHSPIRHRTRTRRRTSDHGRLAITPHRPNWAARSKRSVCSLRCSTYVLHTQATSSSAAAPCISKWHLESCLLSRCIWRPQRHPTRSASPGVQLTDYL